MTISAHEAMDAFRKLDVDVVDDSYFLLEQFLIEQVNTNKIPQLLRRLNGRDLR